MREIKFRGRRAAPPGGFEYGYFVKIGSMHYIYNDAGWYLIIARSQEQYINKKDRYGNEVYEGDIVKFENYWIVKVSIDAKGVHFGEFPYPANWHHTIDIVVIGNIHETPKKLEG